MPAYFIAHSNVKDAHLLEEYVQRSSPIVARCGGELVTVGSVVQVLVGDFAYRRTAVFASPTRPASTPGSIRRTTRPWPNCAAAQPRWCS